MFADGAVDPYGLRAASEYEERGGDRRFAVRRGDGHQRIRGVRAEDGRLHDRDNEHGGIGTVEGGGRCDSAARGFGEGARGDEDLHVPAYGADDALGVSKRGQEVSRRGGARAGADEQNSRTRGLHHGAERTLSLYGPVCDNRPRVQLLDCAGGGAEADGDELCRGAAVQHGGLPARADRDDGRGVPDVCMRAGRQDGRAAADALRRTERERARNGCCIVAKGGAETGVEGGGDTGVGGGDDKPAPLYCAVPVFC